MQRWKVVHNTLGFPIQILSLEGFYFWPSSHCAQSADGAQVAAAEAAAVALAAGGIPEAPLDFDQQVVGPFGAGFAWSDPAVAARDLLPIMFGSQTVPSDCDSEVEEFTKVG